MSFLKPSAGPRDLPRRAAPALLGAFNLLTAFALWLARGSQVAVDTQGPSHASLHLWAVIFALTGILVLAGIKGVRTAVASTAVSIGAWVVLAAFSSDTFSVLMALGIAGLHLLLMPYRRNHPELDAPPTF